MLTLRNYSINSPEYIFYKNQHKYQTLTSVKKLKDKYNIFDRVNMKMIDALLMMNDYIDPSDPDMNLPNIIHAYQTAERIRKKYPNDKSLQITGLIHDLGKILFSFGEPSYNVVGDTFVVGCAFSKKIIFYETFKDNIDYTNSLYNSKYGIYNENCGLDKLHLSYGHDEYLYQVLKHNNHKLENKYLNIIRYHSFYPWHTGGDYKYLMNESDKEILKDIHDFNQFDLYSKEDVDFKLTDEIKKYYDILLNEYFPNSINW